MAERFSFSSLLASSLRGLASKLEQRRFSDNPDVGQILNGQLLKKDSESGKIIGINLENIAGDVLATSTEFQNGTSTKAPTVNQTKQYVTASLATGLSTKLDKAGDATQVVKIAQGTANDEAVRVDQFQFDITPEQALEDYTAS